MFVFLSLLLNKKVLDANNRKVGILNDISFQLSEQFPRALSLIVSNGSLSRKYADITCEYVEGINASLFSASILPLATVYYVCEGFGWEAGVNKKFREAPQFYSLFTFLIVVGALVVLIFMLSLVNNKEIMGEFVNSRTFNVISWVTVVTLILLTVAMLVTSLLGL
jgi:uncharacterized membrane protein